MESGSREAEARKVMATFENLEVIRERSGLRTASVDRTGWEGSGSEMVSGREVRAGGY